MNKCNVVDFFYISVLFMIYTFLIALFRLTFNYDDEKVFELKAKSKTDRDEWVEALEYLIEIKEKLGNITDQRSATITSYFSDTSPIVDDSEKGSGKKNKSYKYANAGKNEIMGLMEEGQDPTTMFDENLKNQLKKSESFLTSSGILDDIEHIPENQRVPRIMYGFLGKPARGALSNFKSLNIEQKRWVFLMSSRPLNQNQYSELEDEIPSDQYPTMVNFDTIYYYKTGITDDEVMLAGEIKTLDIDNIKIETEASEDCYAFVIDAKSKKYKFVSNKKFIIENWVDAIQ